jgi:hypothetical protein
LDAPQVPLITAMMFPPRIYKLDRSRGELQGVPAQAVLLVNQQLSLERGGAQNRGLLLQMKRFVRGAGSL